MTENAVPLGRKMTREQACSSSKNQLEQTGATGADPGCFSLLRSTPYGGSGQLEHRSTEIRFELEQHWSGDFHAQPR